MSMTWSWSGAKKTMPTGVSLENIRIASPCPARWEQMAGDERVRHCTECNLNVYNLSEMTRREAEQLIASREGRLCARFFRRADGTIITRNCPVGLRNMIRRVSRVAGAALSAIMSVGFSAAQSAPAGPGQTKVQSDQKETAVSIVITDPQGAVVSGAQIKVENKKAKTQLTASTDREGRSYIRIPAAGSYSLLITAQGFKPYKMSAFKVESNKVSEIKVNMPVGNDSVGMVIMGPASMIDQTESQITNSFYGSRLDVPGASRNIQPALMRN